MRVASLPHVGSDADCWICTPRLDLKPMVRADAETLYPILFDPALYTFTGGSPPASQASLAVIYARRESPRSPYGDEPWLNWLIQEREPSAAIGYAHAAISTHHTLIALAIGA